MPQEVLSSLDNEFSWLPAADRFNFTRMAFGFEGAKCAFQISGMRPRRFVVLRDAADDLNAPPPPGTKRVRLIRHGEGLHNVFRHEEFAAGRTPLAKRGNFNEVPEELFDPRLTPKGEDEARAARPLAEAGVDPELLVVSPLRRACRTGLLAFERAVKRGVPVVAHEMARESYRGLDPSIYDAHRGRAELAAEFPGVDFNAFVPAEEGPGLRGDPNWFNYTSPSGCRLEAGEDNASNAHRAWHLMCWLMDRPERDVAVATHSLFLLSLLHGALEEESAKGALAPSRSVQIFRTGELRTYLVAERPPPAAPGWPAGAGARAALAAAALAGVAAVCLRLRQR